MNTDTSLVCVRTAEGTLLDFLAARALGLNVGMVGVRPGVMEPCIWEENDYDGAQDFGLPAISTCGTWLVKMLNTRRFDLTPVPGKENGNNWKASGVVAPDNADTVDKPSMPAVAFGRTPGEALARCLVLSATGEMAEVPETLVRYIERNPSETDN